MDVYIERTPHGTQLASIMEFPGCGVWGQTEIEVLTKFQATILAYMRVLKKHGVEIEVARRIKLDVVERIDSGELVTDGSGQVGFFAPEERPISLEELETQLQYARIFQQELIDLIHPLNKEVKKWRPFGDDQQSINDVLHHMGVADLWYLTRLDEALTSEAEYEETKKLATKKLLKVSREKLENRLRDVVYAHSDKVFQPPHLTTDPSEKWSVRKVLRRMIQHQRDHTSHVHAILAAWRREYLANLWGERAHLLWSLVGLEDEVLKTADIKDGWTAKDMLFHIARWEAEEANRLSLINRSDLDNFPSYPDEDLDEKNMRMKADHANGDWSGAVNMLLKERRNFTNSFKALDDTTLHKQFAYQGKKKSGRYFAMLMPDHDKEHAVDILAWRKTLGTSGYVGTADLLIATARATRHEYISLANCLQSHERDTREIEGFWTVKDVIGHLADYEAYALDCFESGTIVFDAEASESVHMPWAEARKPQKFEAVFADFQTNRRKLIDIIQRMSPEELNKKSLICADEFWKADAYSPFEWMMVWLYHERVHCVELRKSLGLKTADYMLKKEWPSVPLYR